MKKIGVILASVFLLVGCSAQQSVQADTTTEEKNMVLSSSVEEENYDETYDADNATTIVFNDTSVETTGSGIVTEGTTVTINTPGTYVVSGTTNDGQILVDSPNKGTVKIVLNDANITSTVNSPIYIKESDKTIITLFEGTTNTLEDAKTYTLNEEEEPTATIFSKDDLVLNGSGTLTVIANYNDGITSKDDLWILNTSISIESVDDGIVGKDSLYVDNAILTINAGGDGLKSTNDTESDKGTIVIESGIFNITSMNDGIQAETTLQIQDGTFNIHTGEGAEVALENLPIDDFRNRDRGNYETVTTTEETSVSAKGLKAGSDLSINDGVFTLDTEDDSIHSNTNVHIYGGDFTIKAGDDAIHADETNTIHDGTIQIETCYEGIEGSVVIINGGTINIYSLDDGINAAGDTGEHVIEVNGGNITVVMASGDTDGFDSNGSIVINDGVIDVTGTSCFDFDTTAVINGGTVTTNGTQITEIQNSMQGGFGGKMNGEMPSGDFSQRGERPQMPEGEMPEGEMPQKNKDFYPGHTTETEEATAS